MVAVGIRMVFGVGILINRKRGVEMKMMEEEENVGLQKGKRARGKRRKHGREPQGIEMIGKRKE